MAPSDSLLLRPLPVRSSISGRCTLLAKANLVYCHFREKASQVLCGESRHEFLGHFRLESTALTSDTLVDPLPQMWILAQIQQAVVLFPAHAAFPETTLGSEQQNPSGQGELWQPIA